jgi:hypothetical protein
LKLVKVTVGILFIILLAGCGNKDKNTIHINYSEGSIVGMEGSAPDLSYAVEHMSPGVLVNQVGYESQGKWLEKIGASSLNFRAYMNDIFRISTIKNERGIYYPFSRSISFSLGISF